MKTHFTETEKQLLQNFIVIKEVATEEEAIFILNRSGFIEKPLCECYDQFGQQIGCEGAECYSAENSYIKMTDGSEEAHTQCTAFDYFDGHNWRSVIISADTDAGVTHVELDDEKQIEILKQFDLAEWPVDFKMGIKTTNQGDYTFINSLFANDPWLAKVA